MYVQLRIVPNRNALKDTIACCVGLQLVHWTWGRVWYSWFISQWNVTSHSDICNYTSHPCRKWNGQYCHYLGTLVSDISKWQMEIDWTNWLNYPDQFYVWFAMILTNWVRLILYVHLSNLHFDPNPWCMIYWWMELGQQYVDWDCG